MLQSLTCPPVARNGSETRVRARPRSVEVAVSRGGQPDLFHWELARPTAVPEPVAARGRLGLWDVELEDPRL
jgi:hypothetical protein